MLEDAVLCLTAAFLVCVLFSSSFAGHVASLIKAHSVALPQALAGYKFGWQSVRPKRAREVSRTILRGETKSAAGGGL